MSTANPRRTKGTPTLAELQQQINDVLDRADPLARPYVGRTARHLTSDDLRKSSAIGTALVDATDDECDMVDAMVDDVIDCAGPHGCLVDFDWIAGVPQIDTARVRHYAGCPKSGYVPPDDDPRVF